MTKQQQDELREKLAAIEHERWADWQKYCNQKVRQVVPIEHLKEVEDLLLTHWERQIATPYERLSDKEKASDMEQVDRYWPLMDQYITDKIISELESLHRIYTIANISNKTIIKDLEERIDTLRGKSVK